MRKSSILILFIALFSFLGFASFFDFSFAQTEGEVSVSARVMSVCGDGVGEYIEDCDGVDMRNATCTDLGFGGGNLTCNPGCTFNTDECTPIVIPPAAGGSTYTPSPAIVVFNGLAYPNSSLTILKDGQLFLVNRKLDSSGSFTERVFGIPSGTYNFGFKAKDSEGRESSIFNITITLFEAMIMSVEDILFSPTIEISNGIIQGETASLSEINLHISGGESEIIKKVQAKEDGKWLYDLRAASLREKVNYSIKAKAVSPLGLVSYFSKTLSFYLEELLPEPLPPEEIPEEVVCGIADINCEGKVDLIDFSIMLYWWGKDNPDVDINGKPPVDLIDFSIMMYHWTG